MNKNNTRQAFMRILSYTKPYRLYVVGALLSAIISVALTLFNPILIGRAIDLMVGPGQVDYNGIFKIILILGVIIIIGSIFQWLLTLCTNSLTYRTVKDIRIEAFNKLNTVPLKYIDSKSHGDMINRIVYDVEMISEGLMQGFTQFFTGIATIIGTLIFMVYIDVWIAILVVVLTPLSFFVASFIAKRTHSLFTEQSSTEGDLSGYIEEMIGNQKIVKTFNYEKRAQDKFEKINGQLYDVGVKAQFYSSITRPAARFVNAIIYASVGIIGAVSAISGRISIGQVSSFLIYANQYTTPFSEVTGVVTQLQTAVASAQRLFSVLDEEDEIQDSPDAIVVTETDGHIDLDNVEFSYDPDRKFIQNLNISVKPGDKVAIVGPTGCGKTTIINLLMRFYDVDKGAIKIDGVNINDMTRNSMRSMFGMVLQETWLYSASVRDNIAYGKPDATDEEVIRAAKLARAHNFIERLADGYDTIISEDGNNISHGQKQLLCIARVMLVEPPMLILDEATSSIDTMTEVRVQEAFTTLMEGRTSFVVAHRLSTIQEADTILVMDAGNIIETGNHKELLEKGGFYHNLYNSQFATN
ncbi:MAG: ABC transporter ATP-binding protein [Epulopiscium sp.]|nr:ABC transporter ATP-binding protein [Candidatus Epulonipiscium sp.]